jgi:hypothetical protein
MSQQSIYMFHLNRLVRVPAEHVRTLSSRTNTNSPAYTYMHVPAEHIHVTADHLHAPAAQHKHTMDAHIPWIIDVPAD